MSDTQPPQPPYTPPAPHLPPFAPAPHAGPVHQPYPGAAPAYGYAPTFATPYAAPAPGTFSPVPERSSAASGVIALIAALVALVVPSIVGGIAGFQVGEAVGAQVPSTSVDSDFDLSLLSPVRGTVLIGEIAFWAGTALGLWALVQGIVAAVRGRGRGPAIAAIVISIVAAFAFGVVVLWNFTTGMALGAASVF